MEFLRASGSKAQISFSIEELFHQLELFGSVLHELLALGEQERFSPASLNHRCTEVARLICDYVELIISAGFQRKCSASWFSDKVVSAMDTFGNAGVQTCWRTAPQVSERWERLVSKFQR